MNDVGFGLFLIFLIFITDTVEVSSTSQSEVKRLKAIIYSLENQISKFKSDKDKEGLLLAPSNMLSGAKTLARKVVSQLGNDPDLRSQDNLEDSMKKVSESFISFSSFEASKKTRF